MTSNQISNNNYHFCHFYSKSLALNLVSSKVERVRPQTCTVMFKKFFQNTSFHGFHFLVRRDVHWMERVFWLTSCILSWYSSGLLIQARWENFRHSAVSFVVETTYLEWNTKFPSVVVCESDNDEKIAEVTDRLYGDPRDYNIDEIVKELVFYKGISFFILQMCNGEEQDCIVKNFTMFSELVRRQCTKLIEDCKWNEVSFDCCRYFFPMDTEIGMCYALNSKQTRIKHPPFMSMISNKRTGPGSLSFKISGHANVYVLGEEEVPSLSTLQTDILRIVPNIQLHRKISLNEIENQPEVADVSIEQRNCKFMEETEILDVHRYYSYSTCCVQCRKEAQIDTCGCAHHLMPNTPSNLKCNISGLQCLNEHSNKLSILKAPGTNRSGLECHCLPSCTELEVSKVLDDKIWTQKDHATVQLTLDRLPTERFKRIVIMGKLDLIVSMGGATALFMGASLLSFVEIVFYIFVRPLNNYIVNRVVSRKK